ncbi:type II secretion system protein GspL [Polymorphobacter fuscus]|uniref:GspL cytoplasmic actin-ATPase-like domain-containing protein n=1 Tax=Sandarakinorhabdus fusca TaxID=1439888 RepID=A0A7C9KY67_9SPHN|nr:type II secretion system protein GspL [Polymorphobacter fuscus]KAB7648991.1 hypothetical protein F9290_04850 [Polymorphobacter fuscus]MQT16588.1 hypothetical protein [Polymorphobacter fuscus]NJC07122.1 general secretion pathway protein L [Polymorphobacter fuscus]
MTELIVFPDNGYSCLWLEMEAGRIVARGTDLAELRSAGEAPRDVVAVVSGVSVVVHWVELPALAPAQAAAAARLLAADVCGGAIASTHVALGDVDSEGTRPLALVDTRTMDDWLAILAAAGLDAVRIVPLPLLLPAASADAEGAHATLLPIGDIGHVRGDRLAFSAELPLVDVMLADRTIIPIDAARFEASLSAMLATDVVNLRQGAFARKRRAPLDRRQLRRIAVTAVAAAGLWLGVEAATLLRDRFAADQIEQRAADAARAALPRGTAVDAPRAQVAARAARLGAAGSGFTQLAGPLLAGMRDQTATVLQSLKYAPDSGLAAAVEVRSPEARQQLTAIAPGSGQTLTVGAPRDVAGTTVVDIVVRPR